MASAFRDVDEAKRRYTDANSYDTDTISYGRMAAEKAKGRKSVQQKLTIADIYIKFTTQKWPPAENFPLQENILDPGLARIPVVAPGRRGNVLLAGLLRAIFPGWASAVTALLAAAAWADK